MKNCNAVGRKENEHEPSQESSRPRFDGANPLTMPVRIFKYNLVLLCR